MGSGTYLPHREVIKDQSSTTNFCTFYDAIAKLENQVSLNEMFYEGPCLNLRLYKLLLQFLSYPVTITADTKKSLSLNKNQRRRSQLFKVLMVFEFI